VDNGVDHPLFTIPSIAYQAFLLWITVTLQRGIVSIYRNLEDAGKGVAAPIFNAESASSCGGATYSSASKNEML